MGLYFRDGEFKGLLGDRYGTGCSTRCCKVRVFSRLAARPVAGSRQARHDRQVGCVAGPRRRAGPEGLPARTGLDRRPVQPRAAAGPVRLLDRPCATVKTEIVDARKVRFEHDDLPVITAFADGRARAGRLPDRTGPRRRAVHRRPVRGDAAAGPIRLLEGRGRSPAWRASTCARRWSTSVVRRS